MCRKCGLFFTNPRPTKEEMDRFYSIDYRDFYFSAPDPGDDEYQCSQVKRQIDRRAEFLFDFTKDEIRNRFSSTPRILDVGCGEGACLRVFRSNIPESVLFGIEPSPQYASYAEKSASAMVFCGDIETFIANREDLVESFDLVIMSHVVEHLFDPTEKLSALSKFLAPKGLLCIEVPNLLSPHWSGNSMFHIAHILHFTPATLQLLFWTTGFECIKKLEDHHPIDPWAMTYLGAKTEEARTAFSVSLKKAESDRIIRTIKSRAAQNPHPNVFSSWPKPMRKVLRYLKYNTFIPAFRRAGMLLFEYDVSTLGERVNLLEDKVQEAYRILDLFSDNPQYMWLYKNRSERMDATVDIFDKGRRAFHLARYQFACPYVVGKTVADIACGTGYGAELLITEGKAAKVIGVDIDKQAIAYATANHMPEGAEFIKSSGDKTDIADHTIDVVVSFETLEHVPCDEALLREFHRILKPGGILICSVPNNWPLDQTPHHVRVYDRHSFESMLSRCFVSLQLYNQNSGSISDFNHGQPRGICKTDPQNESTAECYIALCMKP
jgi:SAM-dependent methyltransferase